MTQPNQTKNHSGPRGVWIGGTGRMRYYRLPLGEAVTLNLGQEFNGGIIEGISLRTDAPTPTKPVDVRVRYDDQEGTATVSYVTTAGSPDRLPAGFNPKGKRAKK